MSSSPSGSYKSRLFNFFQQRFHRLKRRYERSVRHGKVAAVWGVQILLYPIYLLAQSARFAGHQLQQIGKQGWAQLKLLKPFVPDPPRTSDTPIKYVLKAIDTFALAAVVSTEAKSQQLEIFIQNSKLSQALTPSAPVESLTSKTSSCTRQIIRGVASLLTTHTLVLVTAENEILDILTPEQEQKLSSRIIWEVADYWRQWRLTQASKQKFSNYVLSRVDDRKVLPAVRWFWQVMAWVQTGSVAIAANLFQESALLISPHSPLSNQSLEEIPISFLILAPLSLIVKQLSWLDSTVAEVETKGILLPASEFISALACRSQTLLQHLQQSLAQASQRKTSPTEFSDAWETDHLRIQVLIRHAIDYFFGSRGRKLPFTIPKQLAIFSSPTWGINRLIGSQSTSLPAQKRHNLELPAADEPDPWLTLSDLFGEPTTSTGSSITSSHLSLLSGGENSQPVNRLSKTLNRRLDVSVSNSTKSQISPHLSPEQINLQNPKLSSTQATGDSRKTSFVPKPDQATAVTAAGSNRESQSSQMGYTSTPSSVSTLATDAHLNSEKDWIETQATPAGYVKHPLEILLRWLDSVMLWLEEMVIKIWRSMRRL